VRTGTELQHQQLRQPGARRRRPSQAGGRAQQLSYRNPLQNHDCENMDMPAAVTPSVHVTDMACVGRFGHTITLPQSCGLTPTIAWLYIHMSVTRSDVTPRNAYLWPWGSSAGAPTRMVIVRRKGGPLWGTWGWDRWGGRRWPDYLLLTPPLSHDVTR
jgi:hypothetical protein